MIPIRRRRSVPNEDALAIFATAPILDADDLRADLDAAVDQDLHDPYEGTARDNRRASGCADAGKSS
jgi:hypothetical protein